MNALSSTKKSLHSQRLKVEEIKRAQAIRQFAAAPRCISHASSFLIT